MELPLRSAKRPEGGGAVLFEPDGIRRARGRLGRYSIFRV